MVFESKKFEETPEEIVERRKKELYEMWSEKQMCMDELERLEHFIDDYLKQFEQFEPEIGTANDIANEIKAVFEKYKLTFTGITDAVLVYLFEVLCL